jgi:hypothetical protein
MTEKSLGFPYRQHVSSRDCRKDLIESVGIGGTDEKQLAASDPMRVIVVIDPNRSPMITLAGNRFIKQRTERIWPNNPDDKRVASAVKGRVRPINEADEIVEKNRFEGVFRWRRRLRLPWVEREGDHQKREENEPEPS